MGESCLYSPLDVAKSVFPRNCENISFLRINVLVGQKNGCSYAERYSLKSSNSLSRRVCWKILFRFDLNDSPPAPPKKLLIRASRARSENTFGRPHIFSIFCVFFPDLPARSRPLDHFRTGFQVLYRIMYVKT